MGTVGFDSDAQLAWDLPQGYGSSSIIIAIIDSGVDTAHEDLRLVTGYDYGDNDGNPMDDATDAGHGTACAGIAAARANNGIGVAGIAGGCSVMPLKVADSNGELSFTSINNAITHAADNGAHIISMSFGAEDTVQGQIPSTDAALEYAYNNNVTIFAATANENASVMNYPSNHNKVISVGAASPSGERKSPSSSDGEYWWGSNYGVDIQDNRNAVDIMGPTILPTTDISGSAGYASGNYSMYLFNGTSCATPYVAGAAALILSFRPTLTPAELRDVMTSTATDMTIDGGIGWDRYTGYGMVNVYNAIMSLNTGFPTVAITAPTSGSTHALGSSITVNATASDSDGFITQVAFYLNDVWQFTDTSSPYSWSWNTASAGGGSHTIKAIATDNDSNTAENSVSIYLVPPADEGFESGNFSAYPWENTSPIPWTVQSAEKYFGTYAAKSGAISNNGVTNLSLTQTVTEAGTISFFFKVSSESTYDKLFFLIDGVQQGVWSGTIPWTLASYPVSAGNRTFTWRYTKDVSEFTGSDCAWIDHIVLPPVIEYFAPPLSLTGIPADNIITLNWQSPSLDVLSYNVFRDGSPLGTAASPTYQDTNVSNGTMYSYYVTAVYSGGESLPSNTIDVIAGIALEAILGTGTSATGNSDPSPINIYFKSLHGQSVYTAAELAVAGIVGPINITQLGFDVVNAPIHNLPNFVVRMKHTTASNVASWQTGLTTVYSNSSYAPATGWDMLTLDTPFLWNGEDNIVVDTAFSLLSNWDRSGTVRYSEISSGYRYARNDYNDQTNVFSGGYTSTTRPNLKLIFVPLPGEPEIAVSTDYIDLGAIRIYETASENFSISNPGDATLEGTISSSGVFSVAPARAKSGLKAMSATATRNLINYSIEGGNSQSFTVSFDPENVGTSTASITITHNAGGANKLIAVEASAYNPVPGSPSPVIGATNVPIYHALSWVNDGSVSAVDVYLGTSAGALTMVAENQTNPLALYTPPTPWAYETTYYWKVVAHNGSIYSGESALFSFSTMDDPTIYTLPWTEGFETGNTHDTAISGWALEGSGSGSGVWTANNAFTDYNRSPRSGDWNAYLVNVGSCFMYKPVLLQAGGDYRISLWARQDAASGASIAIAYGTEPTVYSMTNTILDITEVVNGDYQRFDASFSMAADGIYYIGIFGKLEDPAQALSFDDISIDLAYDYPVDEPVTVGEDIFTITGGSANNGSGEIPPVNNSSFVASQSLILELIGAGPWTITIQTTAPWGAYYRNGGWTSVENAEGLIVFADIEASKDLILPVVLGPANPTLPVTLSSFTAVLSSDQHVKIAWTAESETNHAGYNILRSEVKDLFTALMINSGLIEDGQNVGTQVKYNYLDTEVYDDATYYYWLESVSLSGESEYYGPLIVSINADGEEPTPTVPQITQNLGNFPNPFNPNTNIRYSLAEAAQVKIGIFNYRGQMVRRLKAEHAGPGYFSLAFDGRDESGRELSSGVYFYRFEAGKVHSTHRMLLLK